nr:NAD-dependent epimerase/dehydratase family protein [Halorubrum sp. C191]
MTVLLTGADGYLGWPTALRLADRVDERIVCVDDFSRRDWVAESGSVSATRVEEPEERFGRVENLSLVEGDLADRDFVLQLLDTHEPDTVLHAAAQPSAPYSSINGERALYTQRNNVSMTLNLLHGLHETGLSDTHFIETTTTGIYGAPHFPIPEGGLEVDRKGGSDEVPFPAMGGSWYHQCYDDETEILTSEGWTSFPELTSDHTVIAMSEESGETYWTEPSDVQSYQYEGEMVTVSNRRLDLKVTPNHRMLVGTSWAGDGIQTFEDRRDIIRAEDLGEEVSTPCFFSGFPDWEGNDQSSFTIPECEQSINQFEGQIIKIEEKEIPTDAWLRFFGWWLAEGSVGKAEQANNVRIYQTEAQKLTRLFTDIGFDESKIRHFRDANQEYIEISDQQLATYLREFADERRIPEWARNLPRERLQVLLDSLIEGDGTDAGRGWRYYTSSEQLADDVQEIALKLGYGATLGQIDRSEKPGIQTKPEYRIGIQPSWCLQTNQHGDAFDREHYDGTVYCCTVDGGLVLVRRGGNPVWCGNSKSFDAANMRLAESQFDFPMSEVRTAIVYGTETDETREHESPTRFDFDYYFGTVVNRFCAQAVAGYPITVYGKGEQRKPMVSLEDAVESLVRLVEQGHSGDDGIDVYNQVTRPIAIVELAETIAEVGAEFDLDAEVKHYENPREEDEEHKMEMENERFLELVGGQRQDLESGIRDVLGTLVEERDRIAAHEDRFLPGVLTDE